MDSSHQTHRKIKKVSTILLWTLGVYLIATPVINVLAWCFLPNLPLEGSALGHLLQKRFLAFDIKVNGQLIDLYTHSFSTTARIMGFVGSMMNYIFPALAIYKFTQLLNLYRSGDLFSKRHVSYYTSATLFLMIHSFLGKPAADSFHTLAGTWDLGVGNRLLQIGFGTPNIELLVVSGCVLVIAWVMKEAFQLKAEQELIV